ncbi:hypothetical protein [Vreelandella titanicae]|uniref:hypothetical protein n=1 Tax=Vreelandella titanicae TaxID=664683 RepID=UPI0039BFCA94
MKTPFSWIDQGNADQSEWASRYLARKEISGSLPVWLMQHLKHNGYQHTVNMLNSVPNDADFRELSEMMKGAWKTRQNRKKHGNPMSLQMPKATRKQLKSLAKKRKQSLSETLSQIISNASDEKSRLVEQGNNGNEMLSNEQCAHVYQSDVDSLLDALLDEISHRCSLKVRENGGDPNVDFNLRKKHHDMVRERVSELASKVSALQSPEGQACPTLLERALQKGWDYGIHYY